MIGVKKTFRKWLEEEHPEMEIVMPHYTLLEGYDENIYADIYQPEKISKERFLEVYRRNTLLHMEGFRLRRKK